MRLAGFGTTIRYNAQQAKACYEAGDWHAIRRLARERITFYDERVREAVVALENQFSAGDLRDSIWPQVKRHYVGLLADYEQPELAETFFNTVSTKILHRSYFLNDFIFVRPAVATAYLDSAPPCYRSYYPLEAGWRRMLRQVVIDIGLACPYRDIERDLAQVLDASRRHLGADFKPAIDCQIHVLRSLFFRNKGAYLIGRLVDDGEVEPFAIPLLHDEDGRVYLDTILFGTERIEALFNFARAYFMVDMDVPSAYVRFLTTLMPTKPPSRAVHDARLPQAGQDAVLPRPAAAPRAFADKFIIAPGIKGLVMLVFTLPSFPYVFKIIKDIFGSTKEVDRATVERKYQLVKQVDRVGRMADTWEYSGVPFPKDRLDPRCWTSCTRPRPR